MGWEKSAKVKGHAGQPMHTYIGGKVQMKISADEMACADGRPKDRDEETSGIT
jgi:hypothetical protein